jgi:hypothetical protein
MLYDMGDPGSHENDIWIQESRELPTDPDGVNANLHREQT